MAKARMLHNKISKSLQVDQLSVPARLLFTWMISWADDEGRLKGEPKYIKGTVVPLTNWSLKNIQKYMEAIKNLGLIYHWQENDDWFVEFVKWNDHQAIRKDRFTPSVLPSYPKNNDNQPSTRVQPTDNQASTEANISESNPIQINPSEGNITIADKNSYNRDGKIEAVGKPDQTEPKTQQGYVAYTLFKRMEPGNFKALPLYTRYAKEIPHSLLFQWASEIEQDKTIKNRGAVFTTKAKEYLEVRK